MIEFGSIISLPISCLHMLYAVVGNDISNIEDKTKYGPLLLTFHKYTLNSYCIYALRYNYESEKWNSLRINDIWGKMICIGY